MREPSHQRLFPPALRTGDTIGIVAPAGVVDRAKLTKAVAKLESLGFHIKTYRDLYARRGYLAGDDELRAAELMSAFTDPDCRAIFPARGGYGCVRLLDKLDFPRIGENPKIFVGFSDNTVLHAALASHCGLVTFHGPHPSDSFGRPEGVSALTETSLWSDLLERAPAAAYPRMVEWSLEWSLEWGPASSSPVTYRPGVATGQLIGGNLALVCSLLGTPYALDPRGCVLFLEDTDEPPYRIDRLLAQLQAAGWLDSIAGLLLGQFSNGGDPGDGLTQDEVFADYFSQADYPILANFPAGHTADNITLPLLVDVELNADEKSLTILESPVR